MEEMNAITALSGMYLVFWAINKARRMDRRTCHRVRFGVVLIGASAICAALVPLYQSPPQWLMPVLLCGVSVVLSAERRR